MTLASDCVAGGESCTASGHDAKKYCKMTIIPSLLIGDKLAAFPQYVLSIHFVPHTVKKFSEFPVPRRDVTHHTLPVRE